jgi:hypothetical protein
MTWYCYRMILLSDLFSKLFLMHRNNVPCYHLTVTLQRQYAFEISPPFVAWHKSSPSLSAAVGHSFIWAGRHPRVGALASLTPWWNAPVITTVHVIPMCTPCRDSSWVNTFSRNCWVLGYADFDLGFEQTSPMFSSQFLYWYGRWVFTFPTSHQILVLSDNTDFYQAWF